MRYRKKPVEIDAWPISELIVAAERNWSALPPEVADAYEKGGWVFTPTGVHIPTLEGTMFGDRESYLICGIEGEFYPCKAPIFVNSFEKIAD